MREVFWVMLSLSLSGAGLAAVVALLQRLLAKRLPAGLFYGLWAAVLLRMIVPAGPLRGVSHEAVVRLEALVQASAVQAQGQTVWQSTALTGTPGGTGARGILWLAVVWGAGAAGLLLWRLWSYRCFCKAVDSRSRPASPEIREQMLPLAGQRGRLPELVECGGVGAPMLLGLRHPRVVLPAGEFSTQQIRDMLAHELVHFRRRDLALKWAAVVVTALHWPNPAAWYALRQMGIFCELSCDERLTKSWPALRRAAYGALLLRLSQGVPERETPLSASFSEQKERLKERLKTIMTPKNTGKKTALLTAAVLAVAVISFVAMGAYAGRSQQQNSGQDALLLQEVSGLPGGQELEQAQEQEQTPVLQQPFEAQGQQVSIAAEFGTRVHPITQQEISHDGVDFVLEEGTPVLAAAQGVVESAGYDGEDGYAVSISHGSGMLTRYCHMQDVEVQQGQTVEAGQCVGTVGSTGNSTGPHLHFSVKQDDAFVDPLALLEQSGE